MNNFKYAISLAQMLYDVDINDMDTLIEIGLVAYGFIGNKSTQLKSEIVNVNPVTGLVKLPCKVDLIEAITDPRIEDWSYTSNVKNFGDWNTLNIEQYIERSKQSVDPLYISGRFVKYRREGDYIYVNDKVDQVCILYHTEQLDEDDLPLINDKKLLLQLIILHILLNIRKHYEVIIQLYFKWHKLLRNSGKFIVMLHEFLNM